MGGKVWIVRLKVLLHFWYGICTIKVIKILFIFTIHVDGE
jgi:hypothetical protein